MKERYVGTAGIVFVVLMVVGILLPGPGNPNVAAADIAKDLVTHHTSVVVDAYVVLVATIPFLFFAAGFNKSMSTGDPLSSVLSATNFGAAVISAALLASANALLGVLGGYIAQSSNPDTIHGMYAAYDGVLTAGGLFLGVFVVTTSLLAFSAHRLPAVMRWAGVVVGALLMIGAGSLAFPFKGVGPLWVIGLVGSLLWIASASVWTLLRRSATP